MYQGWSASKLNTDNQPDAVTSGRLLISPAAFSERFSIRICQFPCFSIIAVLSPRIVMSAALKIVVTSRTDIIIQRIIIRFWRFRTFAEIGIRLR